MRFFTDVTVSYSMLAIFTIWPPGAWGWGVGMGGGGGRCMLVVFLYRTLTRPGHERQGVYGACDGMHACTDWASAYTAAVA